jgi:hypothetical protein
MEKKDTKVVDLRNQFGPWIKQYVMSYMKDRKALAKVYVPYASWQMEGLTARGQPQIEAAINKAPALRHFAPMMDSLVVQQVTENYLLLSVSGTLALDGEENVLPYYQTFVLVICGSSAKITNDILRFQLSPVPLSK